MIFACLGWSIFGVTVVLVGALGGAYLGMLASASFEINQAIAVIAGALVCGLAAVLLKRVAMFIVGGACGAGFVFWAWNAFYPEDYRSAIALILMGVAFVAIGALAAFLLRPIIIVATSIGGGACVALGTMVLAEAYAPAHINERWGSVSLPGVLAFVIVATFGMIVQFVWRKGRPMPLELEEATTTRVRRR